MEYVDDDILVARSYFRRNDNKEYTEEQMKKRYWNNMKNRVKSKHYVEYNIKVEWTYEEYCSWWNSNIEKYRKIKESKMIPSIDRIDNKENYKYSNCRWLPTFINSALGEMEGLVIRMKQLQALLKEYSNWLE